MQGIDRNKRKNEFASKSIAVPSTISDEVLEIMRLDDNEVSPLVKMLWEQQQFFFLIQLQR